MNILDKLNKLDIWKDLSHENKVNIAKNSNYESFNKPVTLYLENNSHSLVYLILSGYTILSKVSSNGAEIYLYYLSSGDLVNQYAIDGNVTTTAAKTTENTEIISINKDVLLDLMEKDFELSKLIMNSLSLRLRHTQEKILNLGVYNIKQRTISELLKLSRNYGKSIDGSILIDAPLNQTDLSSMIGASRESVNRTLKNLEAKEIISFLGHKIAIKNSKKLLDEMS